MGRSGRPNIRGSKHGKAGRKMQNFSRLSTTTATGKHKSAGQKQGKPQKNNKKEQQQHLKKGQNQKKAPVPFQPSDRILLVGEGDFSFSASLATNHGCRNILATCYDNEDTLHRKYPQAKSHIAKLTGQNSDRTSLSSSVGVKRKREEEEDDDGDPAASVDLGKKNRSDLPLPKVLYSLDARKLGASPGGGGKWIRKGVPRPQRDAAVPNRGRKGDTLAAPTNLSADGQRKGTDETTPSGPWDVICFNFPHVGGLSTDVNRQVRANQELLVSFFKACVPLLSVPPPPRTGTESDDEDEYGSGDEFSDLEDDVESESRNDKNATHRVRTEPGQIVVTLFEGEPYTLWNIRDLARHADLRVVTSFRFSWATYPGYSHARTLGEIESKSGGRGGWKGEDREARTYVFERKDHEHLSLTSKHKKKDSDDSGSE